MTDESHNEFRGAADHVVQAGQIDSVVDNRDRRAVPLLVIVLTVVMLAAATIVWLVKPSTPSGDPLAAQTQVNALKCDSGWVVPDRGQQEIAQPPPDAVPSSGGNVTATLQGLADLAVVLHEVRVEVISRKPATQGIYLPEGCAGTVTPRFFELDLSTPRPVLTPTSAKSDGTTFPLKVDPEDVEQLDVTVLSPVEDVEWVLHVRWTSGRRSGELRVDDHGRPFRTAATARSREWCRDPRSGWRPTCG